MQHKVLVSELLNSDRIALLGRRQIVALRVVLCRLVVLLTAQKLLAELRLPILDLLVLLVDQSDLINLCL